MFRPLLTLAVLLATPLLTHAADPFEIKDGDRVLFLGDTLLEREGTYASFETRMQEQFPDRHFTVRNLAFSADTPKGWSRASFDPVAKGFERLKEQLDLVKPTVVFLGYGMAASLQEMTDRSGDPTLNPDPTRYGAEPMSAPRFKKELGELMDAISTGTPAADASAAPAAKAPVRFVLMSPIRHEDLRATKPGLPDPAEHNKLLEGYDKALAELAQERGARFVDLTSATPENKGGAAYLTDNGIHLTPAGYETVLGHLLTSQLGWSDPKAAANESALRATIIRKNELFFHRWRPANETYLFGFRKHEQGQNAKEIPEFDPLIAAQEAEIDRLKAGGATKADAPAPVTPGTITPTVATNPVPVTPSLPKPDFTVADGFQVELWAENPLLYKPTQMNWDAQGRLWVASSALYPQIAPGGEETDTIIVLEDSNHGGKANKSTVFAGGLLIPTGVTPALASGPAATSRYGCFVGQSTELLYFEDSNGDGKADTKRIVLSGFGTEDTHHIIHTLKWGPDSRLYFNQSVYIHTHMETPWGVVRLNSGGVFAWDPRTEKVEVFSKGLWNTWGHQFDTYGQSFQTDGAGSTGITWSFPGSTFAPFEGARRTLQSISPGSYPKFAGLELISSPHFPADWQGNAITCDFRAHRVVRFGITDLAEPKDAAPAAGQEKPAASAGYVTTELPDLIRTTDVSFRPIDVKLGPDGALYIADWSNPVINHGEVDFRDPRRDHTHGRIWRVTKKEAPAVKWEPLVDKKNGELLDRLLSPNLWDKEQARQILARRATLELDSKKAAASTTGKLVLNDTPDDFLPALEKWFSQSPDDTRLRELVLLESSYGANGWAHFPALAASTVAGNRALLPRLMSAQRSRRPNRLDGAVPATPAPDPSRPAQNPRAPYFLGKLAADPNPRVRLETLRTLGRMRGTPALDILFETATKSGDDPFLDYAAWVSVNEAALPWTAAIANGTWQIEGHEKQLEYGLNAIDPALAGATIAKLLTDGKIVVNHGPWIELIGHAGGPAELATLFESLLITYGPDCCPGRDLTAKRATTFSEAEAQRAIAALLEAVRLRNLRPEGDLPLNDLVQHAPESLRPGLARLAGYWKTKDAADFLPTIAQAADTKLPLRLAAIEGLRALGGAKAEQELGKVAITEKALPVRQAVAVALVGLNVDRGLPNALALMPDFKTDDEALGYWRALLQVQGASDKLAKVISAPANAGLPKPIIMAGLRAAREAGKKGTALVKSLEPLAGIAPTPANAAIDLQAIAATVLSTGDPIRGEAIYRRATSGCTLCHAIGGAGGIVGPSLTSIGASAPLDYIIESVLLPNAKVKEGYNAVTLKLKDGTEATGIQARETAQEVILRNVAGQETAVPKANITGKTDVGSIMPAGLVDQLSSRERENLYAFLGQLGRPGPYDASKGNVARVWRLYPAADSAKALKQDTSDFPALAYTFVDGNIYQDRLTEALQMVTNPGDAVYATAQFQVANGGKTKLTLAGVSKAWLDGQPLAIASEPNPSPELSSGVHTLAVQLDPKQLPPALRVEAEGVNFLGN